MKKLLITFFMTIILCSPVLAANMTTFTSSGSWTAPAGVTEVMVEVWGGGGAGSYTSTADGGAGGGGGGYARGLVPVTPGESYTIVVGSGGSSSGASGGTSYFNDGDTKDFEVQATGGAGGSGTTRGVGGVGSGTYADTTYSGGDGGWGGTRGIFSGGGGAGGGPSANGANGVSGGASTNGAGGIGIDPSGDGGAGQYNANGIGGSVIGGGGGGSGGRLGGGGLGARGEVRVYYVEGPSVQRGSVLLAGEDVDRETIDPVILEKSFIRHTMRSGNSQPNVLAVMSTIDKSEEISLSRYYSSMITELDTYIDWEVIEDEKITAQRGVQAISAGSGTSDITISSVNTSQAFVIVSTRADTTTTTSFDRALVTGRLTSATNLRLQRAISAGVDIEVSWQVVEWEGSTVQSGEQAITGTSSVIALSEPINTNNAFITFSTRLASGTSANQYAVKGSIINSTHIRFDRDSSGGTATVSWFVVENPRFYVQRGDRSVSGSSAIIETLPQEINLTKAFHMSSWNATGGTFGDANNANFHLTTNLSGDTTETNVTFEKGTATQSHSVEYEAIYVSDVCEPPLFGDWHISGSENCVVNNEYNLMDNNFVCEGTGSFTVDNTVLKANSITSINACSIVSRAGGSAIAQFYPTITLTDRTVLVCGSNPQAIIYFENDGELVESRDANFLDIFTVPSLTTDPNEWALPRISGIGNRWEVRATLSSGSTPSGTLDSWLSLGSTRSWSLSTGFWSLSTGFGSQTSNLFIEIRDANTLEVLDSANITLQVDTGVCL